MRHRFARGVAAVAASLVMAGASYAGDLVKSGPSVGESASPFDVEDVTGPNKGRSLCYR